MKFFGAVLFTMAATAGSLRVPPTNHTLPASTVPSADTVHKLHAKLETMASALQHMLESDGALAKSTIGPAMKTSVGELNTVLKETASMKDRSAAMRKLLDAKAGLASLTTDLTARQVAIMKEEEMQKDSLLLGVLMTHQKEPMVKQMTVLKSKDFAMLPVSQALLAKHTESVPLFTQAAAYLDTHGAKGVKAFALTDAASSKAEQETRAASLQKTVDSMQKSLDTHSMHHVQRMTDLAADLKKAKVGKNKRVLQALIKREERNFKKWAAPQKNDIDAMTLAVTAVRKGDMKALAKAQAALEESAKALKDHNAGFLVLLSLGHKLMGRDCPYCVAQCVDTCHQAGKPYAQCLTDCAEAGK